MEPLHDLGPSLGDGHGITGRAALERDAIAARPTDAIEQVRGLEHRLGGDATAMQARAADAVPVHERDAEPELGGPEGGGVATGAGAQDDEVEGIGLCGVSGHGFERVGRVSGITGRWYRSTSPRMGGRLCSERCPIG